MRILAAVTSTLILVAASILYVAQHNPAAPAAPARQAFLPWAYAGRSPSDLVRQLIDIQRGNRNSAGAQL
jgi:hypothetical protein